MSERYHNYPDWDDSVYGNGPTEPPKNRGALVALMLILIIFLCGIVTMLSLMNIRLFRELNTDKREEELAISFTTEPTVEAVEKTAPTQPAAPAAVSAPNATMNLQAAPKGIDNIPEGGGMSLQDIYTLNIPSVVSITCQGSRSASSGTGVVLSVDGYIVTNAHVVENAHTYTVQLTDDRTFSARLVGCDDISDLAVLRIDCTDLTPAQFGDSSTLRVGDTVVAIGDPLGAAFRGTYTDGIVSAINRDVDMNGRTMTLIQTNAALNSGNSGGPLINCYGQVIGINTMKIGAFTDTAGVEGLGFAIPSVQVERVVNDLLAYGALQPEPVLGVSVRQIPTQLTDTLWGLEVWADAGNAAVTPGGAADRAGIQTGDYILAVDGQETLSSGDVLKARWKHHVGDEITLTIWRDGQILDVTLELTDALEK